MYWVCSSNARVGWRWDEREFRNSSALSIDGNRKLGSFCKITPRLCALGAIAGARHAVLVEVVHRRPAWLSTFWLMTSIFPQPIWISP
jgi:hypothetical protein